MNAVFVELNQLLNSNNVINQSNEQKSENILLDKGLFLQEVDHYLEKYPPDRTSNRYKGWTDTSLNKIKKEIGA